MQRCQATPPRRRHCARPRRRCARRRPASPRTGCSRHAAPTSPRSSRRCSPRRSSRPGACRRRSMSQTRPPPRRGLRLRARAAGQAGNGLAAVLHDLAAVLALGLLGRMGEAEQVADDAEQAARVSANAQLLQWTLWLRAWVLMERGQIDPAYLAATESAALAAELDDSASGVVARAVLGAILATREEPARARELLAAYDIDHGWICRWAPVLVECDLALNDLTAAREHAGRAAALAPGTGMAGARAAAGPAPALGALAHGDVAGGARPGAGGPRRGGGGGGPPRGGGGP